MGGYRLSPTYKLVDFQGHMDTYEKDSWDSSKLVNFVSSSLNHDTISLPSNSVAIFTNPERAREVYGEKYTTDSKGMEKPVVISVLDVRRAPGDKDEEVTGGNIAPKPPREKGKKNRTKKR